MPNYDYLCNHCGHRFEIFQYMTDDPLKTCPDCHGDTLQRLIGAGAGLLFKGSGFYLTDYKKSSSSPASSSSSSSSGESASSGAESPPPSSEAAKKDAGAKPTSGAKPSSGDAS